MGRPLRGLGLNRFVVLPVAAVALVALAVFVANAAVSSATDREPAAVRAPAPPATDPRGFPRTFSYQQCGGRNDSWIERNDLVIGYAYCNIAKLRKRDPKAIFLLQPGVYPSGYHDGKPSYGGMSVTYGSGLYDWQGTCDKLPGGVNLGCIRAFDPEWDYLYNADGVPATIDSSSTIRGWNLADPTHKGTRELVAKVFAYAAKLDGLYTKGWDGTWSDNWIYGVIGKDYAYGPDLDTDRDGQADDPATLRRNWDDGLNAVGEMLRSYLPGKIVGGNGNWYGGVPGRYFGTDPTGWLKSSNLTTFEGIERWRKDPRQLLSLSARWLSFPDPKRQPRYVLFIQNALTSDGATLRVPAGTNPNDARYMLDPAVMRSMRWGLTLSLVAGAYYRIVLDGDAGTNWWYDEYDGGRGVRRRNYLGSAVHGPVSLGKAVWRRDFEHGIAVNNSSNSAVHVDLHGRYRHLRGAQDPKLNDGRVVSSVTVPAHDGVILLDAGS
jgi:hypothetical protein